METCTSELQNDESCFFHILSTFSFRQNGPRRAVVFYLDKGTGFLSYLTWSICLGLFLNGHFFCLSLAKGTYYSFSRWLLAWKEIGLDSKEEVKL